MKYLLIITLLCAKHCYSQNTHVSDSLLNDLSKQQTDTGKIKTLSELTFFLCIIRRRTCIEICNSAEKTCG